MSLGSTAPQIQDLNQREAPLLLQLWFLKIQLESINRRAHPLRETSSRSQSQVVEVEQLIREQGLLKPTI